MKTFDLKASLRKTTGKKDSKNLRKNKQVPCVLYGGGENVHFYAEARDFKDLVYTPHVYVVNLDVEGKKHLAVMKELQFHPVTDALDHIDFVEVSDNKPIRINLPVVITGNSVGIRAGGKLRQRKRYVKVKGLIKNSNIGHRIKWRKIISRHRNSGSKLDFPEKSVQYTATIFSSKKSLFLCLPYDASLS